MELFYVKFFGTDSIEGHYGDIFNTGYSESTLRTDLPSAKTHCEQMVAYMLHADISAAIKVFKIEANNLSQLLDKVEAAKQNCIVESDTLVAEYNVNGDVVTRTAITRVLRPC